MQLIKFILPFLFIYNICAKKIPLYYIPSTILDSSKIYSVEFSLKDEYFDSFEILKNTNERDSIFSLKAEDETHFIDHVYLVLLKNKKFVVSIWRKGAHSEKVLIHSLDNPKNLLYEYISSWPVSIFLSKDNKSIVIEGTGEMQKSGNPKKEKRVYKF